LIKLPVVQKRILSIAIITFFFFSFVNLGCSKLDTTDIGSDLLPAVDNVTTFDTLITINATQGVFNDTTVITNTDNHALGKINNDPLFGTTRADVYAQFKPTFYPYYYGNAGDTIVGFDSVVLCLSYRGFWGDSTIPLQLQVSEVALSPTGGGWDSVNQSINVNYAPPTTNIIGNTIVDFSKVGNYVVYTNNKDSVKNHIRIKLSNAFAAAMFSRDTLPTGNNSFSSDSLFRRFQNGIAIKAIGTGNGIMYTNLTDSSSRLEVHFRRKNGGPVDTTFSSLQMIATPGISMNASQTVNNIVRNRPAQVSNPPSGEIYLQTSPGTYANLSIPDLSTVSNRIIHRAEVIIEQIPFSAPSDNYFSVPDFLYMDLKDTGIAKWKPIFFDLNPSVSYDPNYQTGSYYPSGGVDFFTFGGYARNKTDVFGNSIKFYNFNITRYVQQIITDHTNNYTLRLFAPYSFSYPQYFPSMLSYNNRIAAGRVKVGSGSNANYRMRLRLVYSKL